VGAVAAIQIIEHRGEACAIVLDGCAILADGVRGRTRRDVQAKALYAIEVAAGERPGPYTDAGAEHFARAARQLLRDVRAARRRRPSCPARR